MSRKCISVYLHLVWSTWDRRMWIEPAIERQIHRMIISPIRKLDCTILAINGMPDHVHLLLKLNTTISIAKIFKSAKGTSSRLINQYALIDAHFQWSKGYGAFSVSRWDTDKVVNYIRRQKQHHQRGCLIGDLESMFGANTQAPLERGARRSQREDFSLAND